ncbi:phage major capsid protein [Pseudovibrio exalbescens]|uniref:Capsid protein n=1 Tax=Pseudovibrio exalbescens TaxID=197461 RepID=A0A1U7JEN3_9HYPH|nr:phage major capsid protein [Pseudovibrio exalbescens]OKL43203.1 capsid protein [Pseudovibrio exalbescens]
MNQKRLTQLETKDLAHPKGAVVKADAAPGQSVTTASEALDQLLGAFEDYRHANDERLDELEKKSQVDTLVEDKLRRMDEALDKQMERVNELALKSRRPEKPGLETVGSGRSTQRAQAGGFAATEHKAAFERYVRQGQEQDLRQLEVKALSVGSDADGGYLVPEQTEAEILLRLANVSPIRAIAGNRQITGNTFKKPFSKSGLASGWVGETAARPETASPDLAELAFPTMELYAMPAATQTLLDDSAINVDEWIAQEVQAAFAEKEGAAFISGNGTNAPRGFLDYTQVDETGWSWGNIGTLSTGADGAFAASNPGDVLIDLVYALKAGFRQNARFVFNRSTQAALRKLKDGQGNYLWQPPTSPGSSASLMSFPVTEAEDMPDIGSATTPIAFGDFQRGYLVVDRLGVRILRDPYSNKPYVLFYTTKRVGGGVQDFDAIKLLKFAA